VGICPVGECLVSRLLFCFTSKQYSTFAVAHPRKLKLNIALQPQKPKDKNYLHIFNLRTFTVYLYKVYSLLHVTLFCLY
jgi:hypothetical protein